jgi:hypothetical protein
MKIVNKDMSEEEIKRSKEIKASAEDFIKKLGDGSIGFDSIPEELRNRIVDSLTGKK